ncbi:hypothetical protein ACHHYP_01625 [Achlya hypogyna]|uniref:F-box/LRR-repeat protein 15-like leucin rich repeat domain-containing protein n=1 Tax=Achlya hypogyna TaxID=1202772 RepID=A0A1V9Z8C0_ACHHY|nr:hypothetical protein ACHHYP_01625 [Achlya hypogyna]
MNEDEPSPYTTPLRLKATGRKRRLAVLPDTLSLAATKGYLIPLAHTIRPILHVDDVVPETSPTKVATSSTRSPTTSKALWRAKRTAKAQRLPSLPANNHSTDPVTPPSTSRPPVLVAADALTIPVALFYTTEFLVDLATHVHLAGWDVHDVDLLFLVQCHMPKAKLAHVDLRECTHVTDAGVAALGKLSSLRNLSLQRCRQLSGVALLGVAATVVELDISHCEWVVDAVFSCIVQTFMRLASLVVANCVALTDQAMYFLSERAHSHTPLLALDVSGCVRLSDAGVLAVLHYAPKLEVLRLNDLPAVEGVTLYGCLPQQRLVPAALAHLELARLPALHFASLLNVARGCGKRLVHLDATGARRALTDDALVALGRYCPALETLVVAGCSAVTDAGVSQLVQVAPIAHELSADYAKELPMTRCTRLRHLDVTGCVHVTAASLAVVAACCPELRGLVVSGLPRAIDAAAATALARLCRHWRDFVGAGLLVAVDEQRFFGAPQLGGRALRALFLESSLVHINLHKSHVRPADLAQALQGLRDARFVQLHLGALVTDDVALALARAAGRLTHLNVSRSRQLSTAALSALVAAAPRLKVLDAQHCEHVDDALFAALVAGCPRLSQLSLAGNPHVTDAGLRAAEPAAHFVFLSALNVHGSSASVAALRRIEATHPRARLDAQRTALVPRPFDTGAFLARATLVRQAAAAIVMWTRACLLRARDRLVRRRLANARLRHRHRLARRIQRAFRSHRHRVAEIARREAEEAAAAALRDHSARVLQRALRDHVFWSAIRRHVRLRREAAAYARYVAQVARELAAAECLQRVYRGHCGRQRAHRQRLANAERTRRRDAGARLLQRIFRGYVARVASMQLRTATTAQIGAFVLAQDGAELAALQLARFGRGFLGRRRAAHWRAHLARVAAARTAAATTIQRAFRAYYAGVALARRLHRGATAMQRLWRGGVGRRQAVASVLRESYARPIVLCLLATRSIYQHALAVRWQLKRTAGGAVALALQRRLRGWHGRLQAAAHRRRSLESAYRRDVAARILQRFFRHLVRRGRQARVRALAAHRAACATKIQSVWRMWKGKLRFLTVFLGRQRKQRHAATRALFWQGLTATDAHRNPWSQRTLVQRGAVEALVRFYRTSLRARGWLSPSEVRHRHQKATHIQAIVRGRQARAFVRAYAAQVLAATRHLQRAWRRKARWKVWRKTTEAARERKRRRDEEERAAGVARARTNQFTTDTIARDARAAVVLQRTYRTLRQRHFYKRRMDARVAEWRAQAAAKIRASLAAQMAAVDFQAQVWLAAMAKEPKFVEPALELGDNEDYESVVARTTAMIQLDLEEQCDLLKETLTELTEACYREFSTYELLAAEEIEIQAHMDYFQEVKALNSRFRTETQALLVAQAPFATQGRQLALDAAHVVGENQRLQHELIRLERLRTECFRAATDRLAFDPLLYELDVERLLAMLEPEWQPNSKIVFSAVMRELAATEHLA